MTDTKKKINDCQKFMAELNVAAQNKESLLLMARDVIEKSHTPLISYKKDIPEDSTALDMQANYTLFSIRRANLMGKDLYLPADKRLILIKQRYQKQGFGDFDKDFKKAYPQEYGVKTANLSPLAIQAARRAAGLMV